MTDLEANESTGQIPLTDLEPQETYTVGDIVTSTLSKNPSTRFVLIEPVKDTVEGPLTNRIEIDENGDSIGSIGTIYTEDIAAIVGHMTPDEVMALHLSALVEQYPTMPPEDRKRLARAAFV